MNIDSIQNGYVIDHIKAKNAINIYNALSLQELDCSVAIITNVKSKKMGRKDIIKIDKKIDLDMTMLGFLDKNATINVIENGVNISKTKIKIPDEIINLAKCQNPRCITKTERGIDDIFYLKNGTYRCAYCESALEN